MHRLGPGAVVLCAAVCGGATAQDGLDALIEVEPLREAAAEPVVAETAPPPRSATLEEIVVS